MLLAHTADAVAKVIGMSASGVESNVSGTLVDAQSLEASRSHAAVPLSVALTPLVRIARPCASHG